MKIIIEATDTDLKKLHKLARDLFKKLGETLSSKEGVDILSMLTCQLRELQVKAKTKAKTSKTSKTAN